MTQPYYQGAWLPCQVLDEDVDTGKLEVRVVDRTYMRCGSWPSASGGGAPAPLSRARTLPTPRPRGLVRFHNFPAGNGLLLIVEPSEVLR